MTLHKNILIALTAISILLHTISLNYPPRPVFDEKHFAMYASFYSNSIAHFDIHPPLGKIIFASVLPFYPPDISLIKFLEFEKIQDKITLIEIPPNVFGKFPYLPLRLISILFGILVSAGVYALARSLGIERKGALFAFFATVFDTSILLHTRLILLDGMYLVFGLFSLALFFHKPENKKWGLVAGLFWGLSLGVKFTAITFIGAPVMAAIISPGLLSRLKHFIATGLIVMLILSSLNLIFFSSQDMLKTMAFFLEDDSSSLILESPIFNTYPSIISWLLWFTLSLKSYTSGGGISDAGTTSHWTDWVIGRGFSHYEYIPNHEIGFVGNPVLWTGVSLTILFVIFLIIYNLIPKLNKSYLAINPTNLKTIAILLGGYLTSVGPFILLVHRETLAYHYFPALMFGLILMGWALAYISNLLHNRGATKTQIYLVLGTVYLSVIAGFIANARYVYGLPLKYLLDYVL